MKSYTDLEQSKKLAEILPIESADQTCVRIAIANANLDVPEELQYNHNGDIPFKYYSGIGIPCWSLAALLEAMPKYIRKYDNRVYRNYNLNLYRSYYHCCCYSFGSTTTDDDDNTLYCIGRDNWVDACVDMIIKLHEQKLL